MAGAHIPIGGPHTRLGTGPHGPILAILPGFPSIVHTFMDTGGLGTDTGTDLGGQQSTGASFRDPPSGGLLIDRGIPAVHISGALQDHPFRVRLPDPPIDIEGSAG